MAEAARRLPPTFEELCETASETWLVRQLLHSLSKWDTVPYPEGWGQMIDHDRKQYVHHDKVVINEIAKRLNVKL